MTVEVTLAGDVTVASNAVGVERRCLTSSRARAVLAMLTLERVRGATSEQLAEVVWPSDPPSSWPAALRNVVSEVRAFLAPVLSSPTNPIQARSGYYHLQIHELVVDVEEAETAIEDAQRALLADDAGDAYRLAEQGTSCLRKPFLPDRDGTWINTHRWCYEELVLTGLEVMSLAALALGQKTAALAAGIDAIARAPLRESAHRCVMVTHLATGNCAEGLRIYESLRQVLADEMGVSPSPETEGVYRQLLGS